MESPESSPPRAREAVARGADLLARRPHFRAELAAKLAGRGFAEAEVEAALDRLAELGYLDDRATAAGWIATSIERKAWGPRRLRAELGRRGVDEGLVDELVGDAYPDGERPVAERAAARWSGRDPAALGRHLERRGFSSSIIIEIVHKLAQREEPGE